MPLIDDEGTDGSSFIWTIQNFSYCLQKAGEHLESPSFTLDTESPSTFRLRLYPKGYTNTSENHDVCFELFLENSSTLNRRVEYTLSIRSTSGSFLKVEDLIHTFSSDTAFGHQEFLKVKELRGIQAKRTYLDNDTMTLRCRIMKVDDSVVAPGKCYARTIINVERFSKIWCLEKFRQNRSSDEIAEKKISFKMLSPVALEVGLHREEGLPHEGILLEVTQTDKTKRCFLTWDLTLLHTERKDSYSKHDEHWFDVDEVPQVWCVVYVPSIKISECEKPHLHCELVVSSGSEYSHVERIENGKPGRSIPKMELDYGDSWKDDLLRFYTGGLLTDLTIHTQTKAFPVHKAILCARSTVFRAMFEQDMQENRSGVVNVEDVDADTIHKMLLFVYSDTVEDLDCDVACKLYFAADKYRITALKRKCSDFLMENLSVANVCEVLVLSSMHLDGDLMLFLQDFVVDHADEVMRSREWKRFMQDQPHLASEIMHKLCLQNSST